MGHLLRDPLRVGRCHGLSLAYVLQGGWGEWGDPSDLTNVSVGGLGVCLRPCAMHASPAEISWGACSSRDVFCVVLHRCHLRVPGR